MDRRERPSKGMIKRLELLKERKSLEARIRVLTKKQKEKEDHSNAIKLAARVIVEQEGRSVTAVKPCEKCDVCQGRRDCFVIEVNK